MGGARLRVLVTNDDGVQAPGIHRLARAAHDAGHDVTVAAPHEEASGMGAALTAVTDEGRVKFSRVFLTGLDGVPAFAVVASPAYIALPLSATQSCSATGTPRGRRRPVR
ncbi:5'/3'-nucleotidase SurE [Actinoplanes sp. NPDC048791]|uniref:5'/3'-nucleotidase SurE n=1 Tax=Actinoplanes sp. NPDC048791 TaxID=3154623 RepID=UPI0033C2C260